MKEKNESPERISCFGMYAVNFGFIRYIKISLFEIEAVSELEIVRKVPGMKNDTLLNEIEIAADETVQQCRG